jgi:DNA-directed RNA polymerase subunit RPC12/RpoP
MTEFKFSCPSCRQNFKVDTSVCGRKIECPSCQAKIIAPEAPKDPNVVPVATLDSAQPVKPATSAPAPAATPTTAPAQPKKAPEPAPRPQIPILTAEIKQEIIGAVRTTLADKNHWMPRFNGDGQPMYAAKKEGDQLVPVSVDDPDATHFSLLGAVLREFNRRNVMRTAAGRKRFLDTSIPQAILNVIKKDTGKAPEDLVKTPLTHEQTLRVLDLLETKFDDEADLMAQALEKTSRLGKTRVVDLAMRIENEEIVTNEEIATALINELEELKARLATLEAKAGLEHGKKEEQK